MNPVEKDSQARFQALSPHASFIVQAPAGSGKTELLTQRFLKLLSLVKRGPEEILAVTFTRKAAAQMRQRIINALNHAYKIKEAPKAAHERLTWELARNVLERDKILNWDLVCNPNRLRIVTIDALSTAITQRLPILSQMGSGMKIVEFAFNHYQQAVNLFLEDIPKNNNWQEKFNTLLLHFDNRVDKLIQLLVTLLGKRDQWLPFLAKWRTNVEEFEAYLNKVVQQLVSDQLTVLKDSFTSMQIKTLLEIIHYIHEESIDNFYINFTQSLQDLPGTDMSALPQWLGIIELFLTQEGEFRKTLNKNQGFLSPSGTKDKQEQQRRKEKKELVYQLIEQLSLKDNLQTDLHSIRLLPLEVSSEQIDLLKILVELLPVLVGYLQIIFQQKGEIDFIQISLGALDALGDELAPSDLALSLDYKIQHILIDEYQDTSITQYRLFEKLTQGWQPNEGRTLFLVGDPMQSIYRFRGAQVSLFLYTQRNGLGAIKLESLTLNVNFRSTPNIINWINQTFTQLFPKSPDETLGGVNYTQAATTKLMDMQSQVSIELIPNKGGQPIRIVELLFEVLDKYQQAHVGVLVRTRSQLSELLNLLKPLKIPFKAHEVEHLSLRSHVTDLISLLNAITDKTNRLAWFAILRAPWLGLSLEDLLLIGNYSDKSIWHALENYSLMSGLSTHAVQRLEKVVPILQYWFINRDRKNLSQNLRGLWILLGGASCYKQINFLDDIDKTLELIEQYSRGGRIVDQKGFLAKLEILYGDMASSVEEQDNALIEIMTIHKAKGLEFDIVIMPHLEARPKYSNSELLLWLERSHRQGLDLLLAAHRASHQEFDPLYRFVAHQLTRQDEYEATRLFYVGATRTKYKLFLLGECEQRNETILPPSKRSFLGMLWPYIDPLSYLTAHSHTQTLSVKSPISYHSLPAHWELPIPIQLQLHNQMQPKALEENLPKWEDKFAKTLGIVFHRIIQSLSREMHWQILIPIRLKAAQTTLQRLGIVDSKLSQAMGLLGQGLSNLQTDLKGQWLMSSSHHFHQREWRLSCFSSKGIKSYIIDYSFVDSNNVRWIVDYKFSQTQEKELSNYREQLIQYQILLKNIEKRPIRMGLYFPLDCQWHEIMAHDPAELTVQESTLIL